MIDEDFIAPTPEIAIAETARRNVLIDWFSGHVNDYVKAAMVSGSMATGPDYAITPKSDIDWQLLITRDSAHRLLEMGCFDETELAHAISGYVEHYYNQFSLTFKKDGVRMECHFWDEDAFYQAISYDNSETLRLRSTVKNAAKDYGYSLTGLVNHRNYHGEVEDGYPVSVFPTFRIAAGIIYLCRPITNILGNGRVIKSNDELEKAIDKCWIHTAALLSESLAEDETTPHGIALALPGKRKLSPAVQVLIEDKTAEYLKRI